MFQNHRTGPVVLVVEWMDVEHRKEFLCCACYLLLAVVQNDDERG